VVHAVGASYTEWEGYLEEASGRAVIGLSYDKLCHYVKPGNTILLSDGTITLQVGHPDKLAYGVWVY
jgi:pyruvate kinase